MRVSCIDRDRLEKTKAYYGARFGDNSFEVYAIARFEDERFYLLKFPYDRLRWFQSSLFQVTEDSMPYFWIYRKFNWPSKVRNDRYDFYIHLREFWGPEEFISNRDFLFDVHENAWKAEEWVWEVVRKYGNRRDTGWFSLSYEDANFSYDAVKEAIRTRHMEIQVRYMNHQCWILTGRTYFFGDSDGAVSLSFDTPDELLSARLIDGKTLAELWPDIIVESIEG